MNTDSKSIFLSVTFWGLVLTVLGPLLANVGVTLPADTSGLANEIVGLLGALLALYGRFRATTPVHIIAPASPPSPLTGA